jgi:hypothetical protein
MEALKKEIQDILISGYAPAKVEAFFDTHSFGELFKQVFEIDDENLDSIFHNFITQVFRVPSVVESFIMDSSPAHRELITSLMMNEEEKWREILGIALAHYVPNIVAYLSGADDKLLEEYLSAVFVQLNDPSTSIGLKALNNLQRIAKESKKYNYNFIKRDLYFKFLVNGIQNPDSVVAMRYLDLLIYTTNLSEEVFNLYQEKGYGDMILTLYKSEDVLVKLTMVESLQKMGDSAWNAKFIATSAIYKTLVEECFDPNADLYIQKNLLLLLTKLLSRGVIPFDVKLKPNIVKLLLKWLTSGFNEELQGALDAISSLVLRNQGVEMILHNQDLVVTFFVNAHSSNVVVKKRFLHAMNQIYNPELDVKDETLLKKCWVLLGDIFDLMNNKITILEISKTFNKGFDYLFKLLHLPFADLELEALHLLQQLLKHEWAILEFCKEEKSMKYLTEHLAKDKDILDTKKDVIRYLIQKLDKPDQTDIFLIQYKKKLEEFIKVKHQIAKEVSYQTEIL